jgi:hypothetical protein
MNLSDFIGIRNIEWRLFRSIDFPEIRPKFPCFNFYDIFDLIRPKKPFKLILGEIFIFKKRNFREIFIFKKRKISFGRNWPK